MEALSAWHAHDPTAGIAIRDGPGSAAPQASAAAEAPEADAALQADMEMARRLQAQLDVQQARGQGGRRGSGSAQAAPYIKISEEEIADDYPLPAQYKKASAPRSDCQGEKDPPIAKLVKPADQSRHDFRMTWRWCTENSRIEKVMLP